MIVIISKAMLLTKTISFSQNNYSRYDCVSWDFNAAGMVKAVVNIMNCMQFIPQ